MGEIIHAFGIDTKLIIIQIINFSILLAALWYFLYTPILNLLEDRQKKIERGIKDAEAGTKKLEAAEEEKRALLTKAHSDAETIVEHSKAYAEKERERIVEEARTRSEHIVSEAHVRAKEEAMNMYRESEAEIARAVVLGMEKVLKEKESSS